MERISHARRFAEAITISIAVFCWLYLFYELMVNWTMHPFWVIPIIFPLGMICADFLSGLVHFLADNVDAKNKYIQKWFILPFRNHHEDPTEMTRHDFLKTNGATAMATNLFLLFPSLLLPAPTNPLLTIVFILILTATLFLLATNQIHKWAHTTKPHAIIRLLQKCRIILNPEHHELHHQTLDRYYCITTGWLNKIAYKVRMFEKLTRVNILKKQ